MRLGILGLGNMGEAIVSAILKAGFDRKDLIGFEIKKDRAQAMVKKYGLKLAPTAKGLAEEAQYIIIAVKPQDARDLLTGIAPVIDSDTVLVSIMAGTTTVNILSMVAKPVKVIRVMPNICVKVAEGALGVTSNELVSKEELKTAMGILAPLGSVVEVREDLMDAITALGGSGPAFVLMFLEAMIDAGVKMGLPRDKARTLAAQTMKGTILMLEAEQLHPTLMKEMITSPGGTTIAGLSHMEEKGFKGIVIKAIEEARKRSKELSG